MEVEVEVRLIGRNCMRVILENNSSRKKIKAHTVIAQDESSKLDGQIHDDGTLKGRESRCNIEKVYVRSHIRVTKSVQSLTPLTIVNRKFYFILQALCIIIKDTQYKSLPRIQINTRRYVRT